MSPNERRKLSLLDSLMLPAAISIAIFYLLYVFFLSHLWEDQVFYLYAAKQVLAGVKLDSSRLIVVNPPMIVWFSEIPVAVGRVLQISPVVVLKVITLSFVLVSTAWSARLMRIGGVGDCLGVPTPLLTALVGVAELTIQPTMFGQREQFTFTLLMPYVLAVSTSAIMSLTMTERCAIGFCAGLAVCFKPQQVLALICFELFLIGYRRTLRHLVSAELVVGVLTGTVYLVCVLAFTPYLQTIVPLLIDTYWALGKYTWSGMLLLDARLLTGLLLVTILGWLSLRGRMRAPMFSGALLACTAGAFVAFCSQHTGWAYQSFPAKAFLLIAIVTMALDLANARYGEDFLYVRPHKMVWIGAVAIAVAAFAGVATLEKRLEARRGPVKFDTEVAGYAPGTVVYAFTAEVAPFPFLLDRQLVWASRYESLWMLPAIVQNETSRTDRDRPFKALSAERTEELAAILRSDTAEDFRLWKPKYVWVQHCVNDPGCEVYNHPIDFISWFSKSPAFAAEWANYQLEKSMENVDIYVRH